MAQPKPVPIGPLRSVLSRLLRVPEAEEVPEEIADLIRTVRARHPKTNAADIVRAYRVADEMHSGQTRKSGEPFITHPVGVATILADMGMDPTTIVAALLHDAVEDTDASLEDLGESFGEEVAEIIDGLTKISKIGFRTQEAARAENLRKMMVAMARDVRVIIIKLADRLHNMRTLSSLEQERQELKARETLEIYVPLAARLGMFQIRAELEDLGFRYRYPKLYAEIVELTDRRQPERDRYLESVLSELNEQLEGAHIRAEVTGRAKNYYSIYQKMVERGRDFDEIFDLIGVRLIVSDLRDLYSALGVVHAKWTPVPGRVKDYVARPKFNMYQALHTTVVGPGGRHLEIQIRTGEMDEAANYGVAAHWRYKEDGSSRERTKMTDVPWLGELMDVYREAGDPHEFMEHLRLDLFRDEVFCFTPKGDVECLPRGATPVDFAYAIHTEVGHRTVGAKVNGRLVPLDTRLESGDSVEILTTRASDAHPKEDWLAFVKTSRARSRIRHWLVAHRREEAREDGREIFARALRKESIGQAKITDDVWRLINSETKTSGQEKLYEALGTGRLPVDDLVAVLRGIFRPAEEPPEVAPAPARRKRRTSAPSVVVEGAGEMAVKLAQCCAPVPGDKIFGFVTRGHGVSVHHVDCPNATALHGEPERLVDVAWDTSQGGSFTVALEIAAIDRVGLLRDVTNTLSDTGVMILSSSSWAKRDGTARLRFAFELGDVAHLDHIVKAVRNIEAVFDVYRVLPLQSDKRAAG